MSAVLQDVICPAVTDWEPKTALAFSPTSGPPTGGGVGGCAQLFQSHKEHALLIAWNWQFPGYKQLHQNNAQPQCIKQINESSDLAAP